MDNVKLRKHGVSTNRVSTVILSGFREHGRHLRWIGEDVEVQFRDRKHNGDECLSVWRL